MCFSIGFITGWNWQGSFEVRTGKCKTCCKSFKNGSSRIKGQCVFQLLVIKINLVSDESIGKNTLVILFDLFQANVTDIRKYINECIPNPCLHGGICVNIDEGYICQCHPGTVYVLRQ